MIRVWVVSEGKGVGCKGGCDSQGEGACSGDDWNIRRERRGGETEEGIRRSNGEEREGVNEHAKEGEKGY